MKKIMLILLGLLFFTVNAFGGPYKSKDFPPDQLIINYCIRNTVAAFPRENLKILGKIELRPGIYQLTLIPSEQRDKIVDVVLTKLDTDIWLIEGKPFAFKMVLD